VLSLEVLQRGAESLGMKVSKDAASLTVEFKGRVLHISMEEGELKWQRRLGRIPAWCFSLLSAFVGLVFIFSALGKPFTGTTAVGMWFALLMVLTEVESRTDYQRLENRLVDRAYDLSKSTPEQPRP
jgi:hypothetical protein